MRRGARKERLSMGWPHSVDERYVAHRLGLRLGVEHHPMPVRQPNRGVVLMPHRPARVNARIAAQHLPAPLSRSRIALELESERLAEATLTRNRAPIVANLISMCFVFI